MLILLAWRNVWRNRRRSLIVLSSVVVGVVASVFFESLTTGIMMQMLETQIGSHLSHLQISARGYNATHAVQSTVPDPEAVERLLAYDARVEAHTPRVLAQGLASTASSSSGVQITGVDCVREPTVTTTSTMVVKGAYLRGHRREVLIGKALAEKLELGVGGKLVLMASRADGEVGAELFRVTGIFETNSREFDRGFAYVSIEDAQSLLGLEDRVTTFAVRVKDDRTLAAVTGSLRTHLGDACEVLPYFELIPLIVMEVDLTRQSLAVVYMIIGVALFFGIVNTMLMSVFERIKEFGVLMAMGMKPYALFFMILLEAFMIGMTGAIAGLAGGLAIYFPLLYTGIDLSIFAGGLSMIGSAAVIHPLLTVEGVASIIVIIPFFAVLGAVLPAWKAARLVPVQAIRYV